ncbi:MAG: hypothetical protein V3S68_09575 [Dehalococcoidia bacterium]
MARRRGFFWNQSQTRLEVHVNGTLALEIDDAAPFLTIINGVTVDAGGITITSGGLTVTAGGLTITADGLTITAGDLTVSAGNTILDQGALDTNGLVMRSSDVATVLTTIVLGPTVATTDYLAIGKASATLGGAHIQAMAESSASEALFIECWGGSPATADALTSLAAMNFFVGEHNGANADADMAANSNGFAWGEIDSSNVRQTRMILKVDDGELHLDNTSIVDLADAEDDVLVLRGMRRVTDGEGAVDSVYETNNPYRDYDKLAELGLVGPLNDEGHHLFPLQKRLHFHEDTMWQMFTDMMDIASVLPADLKSKLNGRNQQRLALAS